MSIYYHAFIEKGKIKRQEKRNIWKKNAFAQNFPSKNIHAYDDRYKLLYLFTCVSRKLLFRSCCNNRNSSFYAFFNFVFFLYWVYNLLPNYRLDEKYIKYILMFQPDCVYCNLCTQKTRVLVLVLSNICTLTWLYANWCIILYRKFTGKKIYSGMSVSTKPKLLFSQKFYGCYVHSSNCIEHVQHYW